jgi:hypothetical protein
MFLFNQKMEDPKVNVGLNNIIARDTSPTVSTVTLAHSVILVPLWRIG